MPPCLLRIAPLVLCVTAGPASASAQEVLEAQAHVDAADVRVRYEPVKARDDREIDRRLTTRNGWAIGNARGALLSLSHDVRFGTTVVPSGRHLLRLHRDHHGTWLVLSPVDDRDVPIRHAESRRVPLEVEQDDSTVAELAIGFEPVRGTAETIIFSYDTTSRHTDRDVYRMETEANRGLMRLVIQWGRWRWGLPLTAGSGAAP